MVLLLWLLLIFFVIIPLFKAGVAVYRARRAAKQFFNQFRHTAGHKSNHDYGAETAYPARKRKKINAEDGEFVAFEDIPGDTTSEQPGAETKIVVEQQVVDVEWEDIK